MLPMPLRYILHNGVMKVLLLNLFIVTKLETSDKQTDKGRNKGLFRLDSSVQYDGVTHVALVLQHKLINRSIHTRRAAL